MSIIQQQDKNTIKFRLSRLTRTVRIACFLNNFGSEPCDAVRELITELEAFSSKLKFEVYDFNKDIDKVQRYHVDKVPAMLILTGSESRIRLYGMPGGFQMESFLAAIEMVSNEESDLHPATLKQIASIHAPVRLQVFINPKCPYCPAVVVMAHRLALASPHITSEIVDIMEFPEIVSQYNVHGVPRVVINESHYFEGVLPEDLYIEEVMKALVVES